MSESLRTRLWRAGFNLFPAYRFGGGKVTYIREDWREIHAAVPHNWRTRNYVGTIFGGSIYAVVDPLYMMMLIKSLGDDYTVWDKGATVQFKKPGESRLHARCVLPAGELEEIRTLLAPGESTDRHYEVDLVDDAGTVHATVGKTVYVRQDA